MSKTKKAAKKFAKAIRKYDLDYDGCEYPVCGYHNTLAAFMPPDKQAA